MSLSFDSATYQVALVILFYLIKPQLYFLEEKKSEQNLPKEIIMRIK